MVKKKILNPITAFRKANEARKAVVVKSLKKAQEGIAQDTSAVTPPLKKYKPWENNVKLENPKVQHDFLKPTMVDLTASDRLNKIYTDKANTERLNQLYPGPQALPATIKKLKGGSVKRKK